MRTKYEVWTNRGVTIIIEADEFSCNGNLIHFYNEGPDPYADKESIKWFFLFNVVSITPVKKENENV